jgi:hypothetical protein
LFSQWKRLFDLKKWFIPYSLFTIILTEMAIYNVFVYRGLVEELQGLSYSNYLLYLIPPFLFMLTTNIFTPDKESETKEYFIKQMPVFSILLSLFIACHFLFDFDENVGARVIRLAAIFVISIAGIFRKTWPVYVVFSLWLISFLFKGGVVPI